MNRSLKRLISFVLAFTMIFALLPQNIIPTITSVGADAPTSIQVSAKPTKIYVGQSVTLSVTDGSGNPIQNSLITFKSSDSAVATVDASGAVTGVHSGAATVTATYTGTTVSATVTIEVSATVKYDTSIKAFNIGNDSDGDGIADKFGNADSATYDLGYIPAADYNTWTDPEAAKHIPYYASSSSSDSATNVTGSNSMVWYRGRESMWKLYVMRAVGSHVNGTYDYQNSANTAPWQWTGYYSSVDSNNTFIIDNRISVYSSASSITNGSEPYFTLKLSVPSAGTYNVNVELQKGDHNLHFYLVPTPAGTSRQVLTGDEYYLGNVDPSAFTAATTTTLANQFTADSAGEYYFVVKMDNDGAKTAAAKGAAGLCSITLTMEEKTGPSLSAENTKLILGQQTTLSVSQNSSLEGTILLSDVTYTSDNDSVISLETQADGTAKVTALTAGTAKVTASFTYEDQPLTDEITITVSRDLVFNIMSSAFNFGNDTDGDGKADYFGEDLNPANTWVDKSAENFIPFNTTGADASNGVAWARGGLGWFFYPTRGNNLSLMNPDYQNSDKTAPWEWTSYNSGIGTGTYLNTDQTYIAYSAITEGSEPYAAFKINIPKAGEYTVTVDSGAGAGVPNQHYYLVPAAEVTGNDRATLTNSAYEYGNLDLSNRVSTGTISATFDRKLQVTQAGDYYLVMKIDNDGGNTSDAAGTAYIKTVTLTLNQLEGIYVENDTNAIEVGSSVSLKVFEKWTVGDPVEATSGLSFVSDAPAVATVDASGKVTGVSKGMATITVTMGNFTARAIVSVSSDDLLSATVSASAAELNIGASAQLTVTEKWSISGEKSGSAGDYTFTSSDTGVAVVDTSGKVIGLSKGRVTVTATSKTNSAISGSVTITVLATQTSDETTVLKYLFATSAFNIGNDTNNDGIVDDFGDENAPEPQKSWFESKNMFNTWTDTTATDFIPYYAKDANDQNSTNDEASQDGYVFARVREGYWRLYPIFSTYPNNKAYFTSYKYQNPAQTAHWQWTEYNAGITGSQTYLSQHYAWITHSAVSAGNEPYVTLKLNIPTAGEYTVSVDTGVKKGNANLHFYLVPVSSVITPDRASLTNAANEYGTVDLSQEVTTGTITAVFEKKLQVAEAGEYYLVVMIGNDGANTTVGSGLTWLKSVSLTLDKLTGIAVDPAAKAMEAGDTVTLDVKEQWSVSGLKEPSQAVSFSSDNTAVATVDAQGKVTAVSKGEATITVTMGAWSAAASIVVTSDELLSVSLGSGVSELEAGKTAQLSLNESWSISGDISAAADQYSFTSSDTKIAAVDAKGVVTGVGRGKVTITAAYKADASIKASVELVILDAQPSGDTFVLDYNFGSSSFNIGNDANGDGIADDFGDSAQVANGLLPEKMFNTWTDKTAQYFIPYYATDASDGSKTNPDATTNGYAWARVREGAWRLYPIWTNSANAKNEAFFSQYRYQNAANTAYWQWTEYNEGVSAIQTYLLSDNTVITPSANDIVDGKEPYVTLKLYVPAAGTYHFAIQAGSTGKANLYCYLLPVSAVTDPNRATLLDENYLVGTMDLLRSTSARFDNAFTATKAGEYYLVIKLDSDNWETSDPNYPKTAYDWMVRLQSVSLTLDKQTGVSVSSSKNEIRVGGTAQLTVKEQWKAEGDKFVSSPANRDITFTSSDTSVAKVDASGKVTGVGGGKAIITVKQGSFTATVEIQVSANAVLQNITLTAPQSKVNISRSITLSVEEIWSVGGAETVTDVAGRISFTSSDTSVAKVDANGKVTGISTGKVTITATHKATGKTASVELEVDGVLTYNILTSSFNIANYDPNTGLYDFGDENTAEPLFTWFESKNMFNTWTDKNASKFIPFYAQDVNDQNSTNPSASSNGYAYARVREGLWRLYPIYATYSSNKDYFTTYDYLNEANTALWQWTAYNEGIVNSQTYITQSFTWVSATSIQDGQEPYVTLKLNIPVAGTYTLSVNSDGNSNLYFYMIPVSEVGEVSREVLTDDAYCIGKPLNTAKNSSISYNGGFVAEEAGEYYFVIKMDSDNMGADEEAPGTWTMRLKSITLTPDEYIGISITTPVTEIEAGWYVNAEIQGVWAAGGRDPITSAADAVTFTSSDPSVATVDANGKITGVKKGTVTITATENATGKTASLTLKIRGKGECNQNVYIYFPKASSSEFEEITIEKDGWEFNFDASSNSSASGSVFEYGIYLTSRSIYHNAALDVYVPHDGYYQIVLTGVNRQNNTGRADIYVDGVYAGDVIFNGYKADSINFSVDLRTVYLTTGVHTFNLIPREQSGKTTANYNYMTIREFGLLSVDSMPQITKTQANELYMAPGTMAIPDISVMTADGFTYSTAVPSEYPLDPEDQLAPYSDRYFKVTYQVVSGSDVVHVSENGEVVAVKEGQAMLSAAITYLDASGNVIATKSVDVPVTVSATGEDPRAYQLTKVEIVGSWYEEFGAYNQPVYEISLERSASYYVRGINALGEEMALTDAQYSWSVADSSVLSATGNADSFLTVTAKKVGTTKVTLKVTLGDTTVSTSFEVSTRDGKTGRTLYTDEMIATALENIELYDWAQTIRDSAVVSAQRYMGYDYETLWDSVTSQGIPRSYNVGFDNDPEVYYCRYCKENLYTKYGNYPYTVNPFSKMWKITCPECSHSFPTNDFGSFYELGRTVENNGKFDRITALENHRKMLIEKGLLSAEAMALEGPGDVDGAAQWKLYYGYGVKGGYLYNETCPGVGTAADCKAILSEWETAEGWGVDDGLGYDTGRTWASGADEVYTFVAYYNHFATWFGGSNILIVGAIDSCSKAYLYTGDERYARVACILLDRVADIYPDLTLNGYEKYPNNDGGTNEGHALGRIWETLMAVVLPEAYDIVYPMFDDPTVVKFLNQQAQKWGYGNAKDSADKIRENIETGILREIYAAAKKGEIAGNFGLHQATVAAAASVLDTYPETQEMINWLFQYAETDNHTYLTGGDINNRLVEYLYRDGQNFESPYYNEMGISNFGDAAAYLQMYVGYEGDSIYENPKFLQLINSYQMMTLIRRGTKPIGDSNYAFSYTKYPGQTVLQEAFYYLKDNEEVRDAVVKIAQHLYYLNGGILDGIHYNVFTKDPESFANDIQAFIDEYGEYNYDKSTIMTGYGIGILRDGTLYDKGTREGMLLDTTRDFTINFSGHYGHNHADLLDLGMEAFGLGMTTDLGYPETPNGGDPHSHQWSNTTIGHNTVVVDEIDQMTTGVVQNPLHFDALDYRVKVMDVSASDAYTVTDEYRRTIVMIDFNDDISYGIDFFRVVGGDDHLYTFMPASEEQPLISENLANSFVTQNGGTYAGPDVEFGNDPNTNVYNLLEYPSGYTWMYDVDRADNPGVSEFWLDYQIKDFREYSRNDSEDGTETIDVRLRVTMLNDFEVDEISLVSTTPQRIKNNQVIDHLEKFLVRRSGYDLDTLFTTVYEPYQEGQKYISAIDSAVLKVTVADGKPGADDVAKAVRVKIDDGAGTVRYDYVVYATNSAVTYTVTDPERNVSFNFRGFVGVWSIDDAGTNIYTYVNDGDYIGNAAEGVESSFSCNAITGKITDWQHELSVTNWLDVTFDAPITEDQVKALTDRMIDVARSTPGNSCYMIEGVEYTLGADGLVESARLDLGTITTVSGYVDVKDVSQGYTYDVYKNAAFSVRMSYEGGAFADYSVLDAEIEIYNSLNQSDYTVDSWLRYQIAIEAGMEISRELRAIDQKVIDDAVASIQAQREGLVKKNKPVANVKADYTELDEEIAMMDIMDPALYTIDSWNAYAAVWQEATALSRDLTSEDQQIIDDMVQALRAAREALELKTQDYTLLIILCVSLGAVLIALVIVLIIVRKRRKQNETENAVETAAAQE